MGRLHKLRVAAPGRTTTVSMIEAEVAAAAGQIPRVDLQELEGDELVVELALAPVEGLPPTPAALRRAAALRCPTVRVLSAWEQEDDGGEPAAAVPGTIWLLHDAASHVDDFPVAMRAMLDGVPSAEWRPKEGVWTLAVPCVVEKGQRVVAIARRRGRANRFPGPPTRPEGCALPA